MMMLELLLLCHAAHLLRCITFYRAVLQFGVGLAIDMIMLAKAHAQGLLALRRRRLLLLLLLSLLLLVIELGSSLAHRKAIAETRRRSVCVALRVAALLAVQPAAAGRARRFASAIVATTTTCVAAFTTPTATLADAITTLGGARAFWRLAVACRRSRASSGNHGRSAARRAVLAFNGLAQHWAVLVPARRRPWRARRRPLPGRPRLGSTALPFLTLPPPAPLPGLGDGPSAAQPHPRQQHPHAPTFLRPPPRSARPELQPPCEPQATLSRRAPSLLPLGGSGADVVRNLPPRPQQHPQHAAARLQVAPSLGLPLCGALPCETDLVRRRDDVAPALCDAIVDGLPHLGSLGRRQPSSKLPVGLGRVACDEAPQRLPSSGGIAVCCASTWAKVRSGESNPVKQGAPFSSACDDCALHPAHCSFHLVSSGLVLGARATPPTEHVADISDPFGGRVSELSSVQVTVAQEPLDHGARQPRKAHPVRRPLERLLLIGAQATDTP